jgi:hypothetical protein
MRIPARFNGPATTGHGGYAAGLFASALPPGPVAVSLRAPPPLERDLAVVETGTGVEIYDGETLIATAAPSAPPADPPPAISPAEAATAARDPEGFDHAFPTCFGCGPAREPGDGLRLFAGPTSHGSVAAAWTPAEPVDDLMVWAALDCPSGAAVWDEDGPPMLLGRFLVHCEAPVSEGRPHAVVAAELDRDGRKRRSVVALYDEAGARLAHGEALWIALRQ